MLLSAKLLLQARRASSGPGCQVPGLQNLCDVGLNGRSTCLCKRITMRHCSFSSYPGGLLVPTQAAGWGQAAVLRVWLPEPFFGVWAMHLLKPGEIGDLEVICCFLAQGNELLVMKTVLLPEIANTLKIQKAELTHLLSLFKGISEKKKTHGVDSATCKGWGSKEDAEGWIFISDLKGECGCERQYQKSSQLVNSSQVNVCSSSKAFLECLLKRAWMHWGRALPPLFLYEYPPENRCKMDLLVINVKWENTQSQE